MSEEKKINHFDNLPDSLILKLFHNLDLRSLLSCSAVCIRFRSISYDKSLKRDIVLNSKDSNTDLLDVGLLRKVISFANRDLLKLTVKSKKETENSDEKSVVTSKLFKRIYNKCPKLWYLELENVHSFSLRIQKLPRNLKHLAFRNCCFSFFSLFVKNCRNNYKLDEKITCLDLSYSTLFDSQNCMLLNNFRNLKYLYLEGLFRINNGGIFWLSYSLLENLLVLDIEGTETTCEVFMYVVKNCENLKEFYFGNTYIDSNLMQLKKEKVKSKNLTHICIFNLDLNESSLNFLHEIFPNLKKIYLNNQLYIQINTVLNLPLSLIVKLEKKNIQESRTCLHYKDHKCDKYSNLPHLES